MYKEERKAISRTHSWLAFQTLFRKSTSEKKLEINSILRVFTLQSISKYDSDPKQAIRSQDTAESMILQNSELITKHNSLKDEKHYHIWRKISS